MVDLSHVLAAHIYAELLETHRLQRLLRQRITQRDVLQTQVAQIQQITRLAEEVERSGRILARLVHFGQTRIPGFRVVRSPVVGLVRIVGTLREVPTRNHHRTGCPVVALAYALEEDTEVDTLPVQAEAEIVLVARRGVTDAAPVTVISHGLVAPRDLAVTVQVHVLHIARAVLVAVTVRALEIGLRSDTRHQVALAVKIVLLEQTVGREAPNLTYDLALVVAAVQHRSLLARVLGHNSQSVRHTGRSRDLQSVLELMVVVNREFPTVGHQLGCVLIRRRCAVGRRHLCTADDHAVIDAAEDIEAGAQVVAEETEISTEVHGLDGLPSETLGNSARQRESQLVHVVHDPARVGRTDDGAEHVVADILVAGRTVRSTQFGETPPRLQCLPPVLLAGHPANRTRGEEAPQLVFRETARTVQTAVQLNQITVLVRVVDTSEETQDRPCAVRTVHIVVARGQADLRLGLIQQTALLGVHVVDIFVLDIHTHESLELVRVFPRMLVFEHGVAGVVLTFVVVEINLVTTAGSPVVSERQRGVPELPTAYFTTALGDVLVVQVEAVVDIQSQVLEEGDGTSYRSTHIVLDVAVHAGCGGLGDRVVERITLIGAVRHDSRPTVQVVQRIVAGRTEVERLLQIGAGVQHLRANLEPFGHFALDIGVHRVTFVVVRIDLDHTALAHIAQTDVVVGLALLTTHAQVVLLREGKILHVHVRSVPRAVEIGVTRDNLKVTTQHHLVAQVHVAVLLVPFPHALDGGCVPYQTAGVLEHHRTRLAALTCLQGHLSTYVRLGHLGQYGRRSPAEVVRVVDLEIAIRLRTVLRRDQDHTESTARTVDRRRGSVLQNRDIGDIVCVDHRDIRDLHSVHQDQRL